MPSGRFYVFHIFIEAVDKVTVIAPQGSSQITIAAAYVDNQPPFYTCGIQDLLCISRRFGLRRRRYGYESQKISKNCEKPVYFHNCLSFPSKHQRSGL